MCGGERSFLRCFFGKVRATAPRLDRVEKLRAKVFFQIAGAIIVSDPLVRPPLSEAVAVALGLPDVGW